MSKNDSEKLPYVVKRNCRLNNNPQKKSFTVPVDIMSPDSPGHLMKQRLISHLQTSAKILSTIDETGLVFFISFENSNQIFSKNEENKLKKYIFLIILNGG